MQLIRGGVAGVVHEGKNGFLLPVQAHGFEYAQLIASIYNDDAKYYQLIVSCRAEYEERLNWDTWGKRMNEIITQSVK